MRTQRLRHCVLAGATFFVGCGEMAAKPVRYIDFVEPKDGADVASPFIAKFGLVGTVLKPAGSSS